ncbi:carboxymuconolactone decarboxylase family protein [Humitalea sp. 24SJ18S-53]|uniref:carboxymuconolactone decarboxylase family protein n=1 Tax=Humitalea sp. 24SJ18S-53 TaxID=3422307 RepID=UPI003D6664DE
MARLAYADTSQPDHAGLVQDILEQRGEVPHLYRMLLHAPAVTAGWLHHLTNVRQQTRLPGLLRELVIIRIALLNNAPYEAEQHAPIARKEGVTEAQLQALADWPAADVFDDVQRAVLAYTDAMTRQIQVPDTVFADVRRVFDDQGIVELTAAIATYNMVSRFLEALEIHSTDQVEPGG